MSDKVFIEIEVDEDEVMHGLNFQEMLISFRMREFLDDLADKGVELLYTHIPQRGKAGHPYAEGYTRRKVDREEVSRVAGGHEVIFGIRAGTHYYPVYVELGTGIYSYTGAYIRAHSGGLMYFYGSRAGTILAKYQVAGQRPQRFLYETWRDLAIFTEFRLIGMAIAK